MASFIIDSYQHDPDLMKVIIVEVTRAANTFGRAHLDEIRQAYDGHRRDLRARRRRTGPSAPTSRPEFATLCFYGAIEQLLTAWIFDEIPKSPEEFEQAKRDGRRDRLRRPRGAGPAGGRLDRRRLTARRARPWSGV